MIGMGGFGQIYEAQYIKSGEKAAVKVESSQFDKQVTIVALFRFAEFLGFENGSRSSPKNEGQVETYLQIFRLRERSQIQLYNHEFTRNGLILRFYSPEKNEINPSKRQQHCITTKSN